ncbi:MAG: hypothetical protein DRR16_12245 [Candidatus Parabeggiatoa sp. nov. 3]|nr:MAG: hypothetical protein DRR00_18145 [Gammaproteobacteria bacterium]RKZ59772.1 MAG: hypothetical protein DRQ99_23195 [Gammaproteobacteria bacterium]RKZ85332.1 MAG: hypothetical protein DRR16_12245 [Gammaproteobacteria bacterium]
MLYHDHFYTMGFTHTVCEDYATQGDKPTPFIVLSDGCSSSDNTDVGARILTLTSKYLIEKANDWPWDYEPFGQKLIDEASKVIKEMKLPLSVLHATVMLAFLDQEQDNIIVYVYGDGCLLLKDHHNHIRTIEITFAHNAPYYLTYWGDQNVLLEYMMYEPYSLILRDSAKEKSKPKAFNSQLIFRFPLKKFKTVAIASDGVSQCLDIRHHNKLSVNEVANDLLAFPNTTDEFIKRHLESTLKQYAIAGYYPLDDLSIAVLTHEI